MLPAAPRLPPPVVPPPMAADFRLKEDLPELVDRIVASYHDLGVGHHLGHCPLPSNAAVCEIARDLKGVLFPRVPPAAETCTWATWGSTSGPKSTASTTASPNRSPARCGTTSSAPPARTTPAAEPCTKPHDFEADGQRAALAFLNELPFLRELLAEDVKAAYEGDPAAASLDEVIFCYPGLSAVTAYRVGARAGRAGACR